MQFRCRIPTVAPWLPLLVRLSRHGMAFRILDVQRPVRGLWDQKTRPRPARSPRSPQIPHPEQDSPTEQLDDWEDVPSGSADPVERAVFRHFEREANGEYDAPLPSPADRKLIREQAGLTQQDVADQLHVSWDTAMRWEKPSGYRNGKSLPGREPVGELRKSYSDLLRRLPISPIPRI